MQIKLSVKLFGAFFLILVIAVCAMLLSRHLFHMNFRNYMYQVELEKLESLVPLLQEQYQIDHNWEIIRADPQAWGQRLHQRFVAGVRKKVPPPPIERNGRKRRSRILLIDAQDRPLIGVPQPDDQARMVPIAWEGRTVGWLGLKNWESFKSGPPAELMRRNSRQLYVLSGGVVALTALIALLFSRHLLRPVKQLIQGTRALARRKFDVHINPTTNDELALLANHFNAMAHTLQHYEKMQRQWIADISHELRTPLAVLQGEIEALQDGVREPTPDNLDSLQGEILRLKRLVEDLHLLSLADLDQLSLNLEAIEPRLILSQVVGGYQARLERSGITLEKEFSEIAGTRMTADADRLGQVFGNILDNACKYMHTPGKLKVTAGIEDAYLVMRFEDSGPGVPAEALEQLFDRLYRVDPSRSRDLGGSGLGLSICRDVIEQHQGRIWAEQSQMGGLLIGIALPLKCH